MNRDRLFWIGCALALAVIVVIGARIGAWDDTEIRGPLTTLSPAEEFDQLHDAEVEERRQSGQTYHECVAEQPAFLVDMAAEDDEPVWACEGTSGFPG